MTASAYSLTIAVPSEGFAVTQGEPVIGGLHGEHQHFYCDYCKSWMFTKPHEMDFFVNVRATMLDQRTWFSPFVETERAEGFAWAHTGATYSYPNTPAMDVFQELLAVFRDKGPRPQST